MNRLVETVTRHRRLVVACWVVVFILAAPFAARQTRYLTGGGYLVPGSGSDRVESVLSSWTGNVPNGAILLVAPSSSTQPLASAAAQAQHELRGIAGVRQVARPTTVRVGHDAGEVLPLSLAGDQDRRIDTAGKLRPAIHADKTAGGVHVYLVGQDSLWSAMHQLSIQQLTEAERVGLPITLIILLIVFGALAAAVLPLALAAATVVITGAAVYFISQMLPMSVFVTNAASMVGVGVAIDYCLFIIARYREMIRGGVDEETALKTAMRTSGVAVSFSGLTVVVGLLALFLVDSVTLRSMALGMILVVSFSVLGVVTLVPAVISMLGKRIYQEGRVRRTTARVQRWFSGPTEQGAGERDFWWRWSERVMRRPVLSASVAAAVMIVLALPIVAIDLGENALGQFPAHNTTRVGAELAQKALGPAAVSPVTEVATFPRGNASSPANRPAIKAWIAAVKAHPAVVRVLPPAFTAGDSTMILTIQTKVTSESTAAEKLLGELRAQVAASNGLAAVARIDVGGDAALNSDFVTLITHSMWKIALFIMVVSYIILFVMLRSVVLPLKAIIMTLLSVAAACGVLVVLFKWGWVDHLLGRSPPGHLDSTTPPLLLTLVFGLSMDYEVFMLSRIREAYDATKDTHEAVATGLRRCAGPVTSAALIMVSVFLVFAATGVPSIRELGVGLAVAIALDATIVRLILVPASMAILGRWNWWCPTFLATRMPRSAFGAHLDPSPAQRT